MIHCMLRSSVTFYCLGVVVSEMFIYSEMHTTI